MPVVSSGQLIARRATVIANGSTAAIPPRLADIIHPFPAFNAVLGACLEELAAKVALQKRRMIVMTARHQSTGVTMSSIQTMNEQTTHIPAVATVDLKLEVVVIPVADVDRAKRFYESLGWRLDADFASGEDWRVVQMTPPGSPCSIHFGKGVTTAAPGSVQNLYLVVSDIEAARGELIARGVDVSEAFHYTAFGGPRVSGRDPNGRSYGTYASFSDPDGNSWLLQEIKTRLPGRGLSTLDVANLTEFLREAETRHGEYAAAASEHHWSDWYAAYIVAREHGKTPEEAVKDGARHMEATL